MKIRLSLAALIASVSCAAAADVGKSSYDWSGFYAGIVAGVSALDGQIYDYDDAALADDGHFASLKGFGANYGAAAGINQQFGSIVAGLEADLQMIGWSRSEGIDYFNFNGGYFDGYIESEVNWTASLRARTGVAVDNGLIYVTGGLGYADFYGCAHDVVRETDEPCVYNNQSAAVFSGGAWGLTAGAGTEWMLSDNMSFKAEYLFFQSAEQIVRYDTGLDYDAEGPDSDDGDVKDAGFSVGIHNVRAGVNFHF